jgi:molecular chaperone GrpE
MELNENGPLKEGSQEQKKKEQSEENHNLPLEDDTLAESENNADEMTNEEPAASEMLALKEMTDRYLRLVADFDNFKKRNARERNELIKNAGEDIIKSLLEVLDDAGRAEEQFEKARDVSALKAGLDLIFGKLKTILKNKGLVTMESKGAEFNPELHEAITEIPAPAAELKGKVVDEVQKGYYLNDKIIRHAKVVVGK